MAVRAHLVAYRCGINLGFAYNFGFMLALTYVIQVLSGLWLATRYSADGSQAFELVHVIHREVPAGWLVRYMHGTAASMLFGLLICHIARTLFYGSYVYLGTAWLSGLMLYGMSIVVAFLGYVLPWGLMSYWGATVIINLLAGIPMIVPWILGGYYATAVTLRRFYVLHFLLPVVGLGIIAIHIFYLHNRGSSNPVGIHSSLKVAFSPAMLIGDLRALGIMLAIMTVQVGQAHLQLSHPDNAMPVNRLVTPLHIVPEWYFLAYYATLKAIPSKSGGLSWLVGTVLVLVLYVEARAMRSRLSTRIQAMWRNVSTGWLILWLYVGLLLGIVGSLAPQGAYLRYGRIAAVCMGLVSLVLPIN